MKVGTKLIPKEHIRDWEDETAEISKIDENLGYYIILDSNFSCWYKTKEEILRDYEVKN